MAAKNQAPDEVPEKRPTTQVTIRVHTDTLEHYKKVAARTDVPWTQLIRATLGRGFACELGRCNHATKAARKVKHLEAYIDKYGYMAPPKGFERPSGESLPTPVVDDFVPEPEDLEVQSMDNGVAHDDDPLA